MTATTNLRSRDGGMESTYGAASDRAPGEGGALVPRILVATAFTLLMMAPAIGLVLRGGFGDPDDAMRLVEVRAWMDGQGWYDLTAHRLDPPFGASMHWSRLVDLPMALLIVIFERFTDQATATRFAAVGVPTLYLVTLYAGMARLATILLGRAALVPALFGTFASAAVLVQFQPGRIGHHAPSTIALIFAIAAGVASLDVARARQAGVAGALIALGLTMSLETMPLLAILGAGLFGAWVWRGAPMARALAWFGAGLGGTLPVCFLATVGPDHWFASTCDAFGASYAGAGMIAAAGALALARASMLRTSWMRALAAAGVGGLALLYVALVYPSCLHGPFAGIDPLVRTIWLDKVVESKPLLAFMRTRPITGLMIALPVALGLLGAGFAAVRETGVARLRFMLIATMAAGGLALGFWQVRVFASVTPIALCGGLYVAVWLVRRVPRHRAAWAGVLASLAVLPFTATLWALALPGDPIAPSPKAACLAPQAFAPLAALPTGTVVAPIDSGSHLLMATGLGVFAAPYHRNNDGNRFAIDVLRAAPDRAEALLASRHVTYVMTCPGMEGLDPPESLAAQLQSGRVPVWLQPVSLSATPYIVYRVAPRS